MTTTDISIPAHGSYRINPEASTIEFTVKHVFGLSTVHGHLSVHSGEIVIAEDVTKSRVEIKAAADSFATGDKRRDKAVKGAKFIDVQSFPTLDFESTTAAIEDGKWVVPGTLTAHGVPAPLALTVTDVRPDDTGVTVHATGTVDRYQHKVLATKGLTGRRLALTVAVRLEPASS